MRHILLLIVLALSGCFGGDSEKSNVSLDFSHDLTPSAPILTLIYPSSSPSYQAEFNIEISNLSSNATELKLYDDLNCISEIPSFRSTRSSENVATLSGSFFVAGIFYFSAKQYDGLYKKWSPCSSDNVTFEVLAPPFPTGVTLKTPTTNPSSNALPTFVVSGTVKNHTLKFYSDSTCMTEIASKKATGTSLEITPTQALSVGETSIYIKNFNEGNLATECSSRMFLYTRL